MPATAAPRLATADDLREITGALARAFEDDPVAGWSCPHDRLRPRVLERFYAARVQQVLEGGEVWIDPSRSAAALWMPPGRWRTSVREDLALSRSMLDPRLLVRAPLVVGGLKGIEKRHPAKPPHWYLAVLGTAPSQQGQGLGSSVLGPVLEGCDRDGIGAYLESSKERNLDFYARHGFRVTGEHRLPRGPRIWFMWRDPR